jgi:hypothetical protein
VGTCINLRELAAGFVFVSFLLVLGGLSGCVSARAADSGDVEAHLKAAFVYNFARFVEWPAGANSGPVRIGVLGRGDLGIPLEEVVRGKSANGRLIEVARIGAVMQPDCCEILLIERSEMKHLKEIVASLSGKPVLTVCDGGSCFRDGAMIAFQVADESVRFQINQEAAEHGGLHISSQLLKVAISKGGPGK